MRVRGWIDGWRAGREGKGRDGNGGLSDVKGGRACEGKVGVGGYW